MSNQVDKLNGIALTSIEKLNTKTDANIEKLNGKTFLGLTAGTWSDSGHNMATGRSRSWGAGATRDAMIVGNGTNSSSMVSTIEYYNGSANSSVQSGKNPSQNWQTANGAGTQTSCVKVGGTDRNSSYASQDDSEEWNGSTWSDNTTCGYNFESGQSAGASNTAMSIWAGYQSQSGQSVVNGREWNGSSWSDDVAAPSPFYAGGSGADNNNSVIVVAGYYDDTATSASSTFTSAGKAWYFNGSSWAEKSDNAAGVAAVYSAFGGGVSYGQTFSSSGTTKLTEDSGATFSTGGSVATGLDISGNVNPYFSAAACGGNRCGNSNVDGGTMGGDNAAGEGSDAGAILNFDR
jgi:hypothetical protein